jgi:hypothetical protein
VTWGGRNGGDLPRAPPTVAGDRLGLRVGEAPAPVEAAVDGLGVWCRAGDRYSIPARGDRLLAALAQSRADASRKRPLACALLAEWQRLVLGMPEVPLRQGDASAKGVRERYAPTPHTQRDFERCLRERAGSRVPWPRVRLGPTWTLPGAGRSSAGPGRPLADHALPGRRRWRGIPGCPGLRPHPLDPSADDQNPSLSAKQYLTSRARCHRRTRRHTAQDATALQGAGGRHPAGPPCSPLPSCALFLLWSGQARPPPQPSAKHPKIFRFVMNVCVGPARPATRAKWYGL